MHRFVIVFLAAFGAASVSFAAPANVVADSAPTVSTHEVPVLSFTGMENPDAYSSSLSISPEARAYLDREAVKEGCDRQDRGGKPRRVCLVAFDQP